MRRTVQAGPEAERHLRAGRLTLDLLRRWSTSGGGGPPIDLSEREFGVLRHLMARAGRPCTREELLAGVWQMDFDPHTNVVDVYVHRLRDKLGANVSERATHATRRFTQQPPCHAGVRYRGRRSAAGRAKEE